MNLDNLINAVSGVLFADDHLDSIQGIRELMHAFSTLINRDLPKIGDFIPDQVYREVDGQTLTLDIMVPEGPGPFPVMVYIHGGAWVFGSPATHRKLTHRFAQEGFLVMSVDYRLAPEHPFPAGFEDCIHAVYYATHNAERFGGDPDRLVLAGDSAGANLAAAAAIHLEGEVSLPPIRGVGLAYGVFDFSGFEHSEITDLLVQAYLGDNRHYIEDYRVSPIIKAMRLPPAHIVVGDADELIEDADALRRVLAGKERNDEFLVYPDMPHAFMQIEWFPEAREAISEMAGFLRERAS